MHPIEMKRRRQALLNFPSAHKALLAALAAVVISLPDLITRGSLCMLFSCLGVFIANVLMFVFAWQMYRLYRIAFRLRERPRIAIPIVAAGASFFSFIANGVALAVAARFVANIFAPFYARWHSMPAGKFDPAYSRASVQMVTQAIQLVFVGIGVGCLTSAVLVFILFWGLEMALPAHLNIKTKKEAVTNALTAAGTSAILSMSMPDFPVWAIALGACLTVFFASIQRISRRINDAYAATQAASAPPALPVVETPAEAETAADDLTIDISQVQTEIKN